MTNANTETHKIAKVKAGFVVAHPKDGWIDALGKVVAISASPKATTFFASAGDAIGFSPTEVQKAALAAWAPKK